MQLYLMKSYRKVLSIILTDTTFDLNKRVNIEMNKKKKKNIAKHFLIFVNH